MATIYPHPTHLKTAKSSLDELATENKPPGQKVGRHWRFHRGAVDEWLKRKIEPNS